MFHMKICFDHIMYFEIKSKVTFEKNWKNCPMACHIPIYYQASDSFSGYSS